MQRSIHEGNKFTESGVLLPMSSTTMYHTSPEPIAAVHSDGTFGGSLCFAAGVYVMTAGEHIVYELDIEDDMLIDAGSLFFDENAERLSPIVQSVAEYFSVSTENAEELLSADTTLSETVEHDADDDWWLQRQTAECAKALGYRGVRMVDEQGTVCLIDMLGRESELRLRGEVDD